MSEQWIAVAAQAEVPENDVLGVEVNRREIALYNVDGEVFATDGYCTHGHARLCDGFLEGEEIECPLHQGRFNVKTGRAACAPVQVDVATFPVQIRDGQVMLKLG